MKHPSNRRASALVILPASALAIALGLNALLKRQQDLALASRPLPPASAALAPPPSGTASDRLTDGLLTDSILSIIQSYYVDPERVDNRSLVTTALAALTANPRLATGSEAAPNPGVWLDIDGKRQTFALGESPRYQEVLDTFGALGRALDVAGVNTAPGEGGAEKNVPGSVVLLNSLLTELDAHSALLSPDAYKELRQGTEGAFGGLGVLVGIRDHLLTVIKPLPHSPAQAAGIKKHDRILGIDGVDTYGYTLDDLVEYMRGEPGTEVKLHLLRSGAQSPSEMALRREVIKVDSVQVAEVERDGLTALHLTIENFASRTSREVLNAVKRFRDRHHGNLSGLILDLRSNPGGLLDQAVQVADLFLEDGVIVSTKGRREEVETAGTGIDEADFPVTVLIDGDSASASEIVAGALQDHGRAVVIGQPSFGKGSVQTIFELPGERALKLTIARYYTPAGRSIQNVGIIPDVWLQPVLPTASNDNLFGPYRYKNERFLHSHLEQVKAEGAPSKRDALNLHLPVRKSYYVAEAPNDNDEPKKRDVELELAMRMIRKIHDTYGDRLPEGMGRASHWLALAGPEVNAFSEGLDSAARALIKEKHKVDWSAAPTKPAATPDLALELAAGRSEISATPGQALPVRYRLINHSSRRADHVSVYVRSDTAGFETKEVLVGAVDAAGARDGSFEITIPNGWEAGPLALRVGVAVDAWPASTSAELHVAVGTRPTADLKADVTLVGESGAHADGVLEAKEKARLRVSLQNDGDVTARDLRVSLINLSGTQITVDQQPLGIQSIARGEEKDVFVTVEAAKSLLSPEVSVGLLVESADLKNPVRQKFSLKAAPNLPAAPTQRVSKAAASPLVGH